MEDDPEGGTEQKSGDTKGYKVEGEFDNTMLKELELFQEQSEQDRNFPAAQMAAMEMKASNKVGMKVENRAVLPRLLEILESS